MKIPVYYLDAFTNTVFKGNPIAVCPLEEILPENLMQNIATEINFSETAFVWNKNFDFTNSDKFNLKWFTPSSEVSLCGHGTLGTSSILFNTFKNKNANITFNTLSGDLLAHKDNQTIWLNLPKYDFEKFSVNQNILSALGIKNVKNSVISKSSQTILIELENIDEINPDFSKLKAIKEEYLGAIIITQKGYNQYDFISRYFTPWYGINEDPVTGSAHSLLANYWNKILAKNQMLAYQSSQRGGEIKINLDHNFPDRVFIGGETVLVLKGELFL